MRTTSQKAEILARAGIAVPAFPARLLPALALHEDDQTSHHQHSGTDGDTETEQATAERWKREIDNLFAGYLAARAARSLREAQEALQLDRLRRANSMSHHR